MSRRMIDGYGAQRRGLNFEMVSYIDVHFYNHGFGALDLFRQITYSERSTLVHAVCTQDHGPL